MLSPDLAAFLTQLEGPDDSSSSPSYHHGPIITTPSFPHHEQGEEGEEHVVDEAAAKKIVSPPPSSSFSLDKFDKLGEQLNEQFDFDEEAEAWLEDLTVPRMSLSFSSSLLTFILFVVLFLLSLTTRVCSHCYSLFDCFSI